MAKDDDDTPAEPFTAEKDDQITKLRAETAVLANKLLDKAQARNQANAEYEAIAAEGRIASARLNLLVGTPRKKATTVKEYAAERKAKGEPLIKVVVPKAFLHRTDDQQLLDVGPGVQQVPESMANHWWFRANGVAAL